MAHFDKTSHTITGGAPSSARRRRYERAPQPGEGNRATASILTPLKWHLLSFFVRCAPLPLSVTQVARLLDLSEKQARRHLRVLFDGGVLSLIPATRAALAPPGAANDAALLYGSAPGIYRLSPEGWRLVADAGLGFPSSHASGKRAERVYGPQNSLFLPHALMTADVLVWLLACERQYPAHHLKHWTSDDAGISLERATVPKTVVPDARFVYGLGTASGERPAPVLSALVECDRSTERAERWERKLIAYQHLFLSGRLQAATGYQNARVLVLTLDARRRDTLVDLIARSSALPASLKEQFWVADQAVLLSGDLRVSGWRVPGSTLLRPLVPATFLTSRKGEIE